MTQISFRVYTFGCDVSRYFLSLRDMFPSFMSQSVLSLSRGWLFVTHGLKHARPPCPSPTPGAYSGSCPLCRWCHPTISSSVIPFCSHLWSFPASGSFQMSWFFTSHGQSIGVLASPSVLPVNIQDWFPLDLLEVQETLKSPTPQFKSINFSALSFLYSPTLTPIHDY